MEINEESVLKKLNELLASRGKKGTDPKQLVEFRVLWADSDQFCQLTPGDVSGWTSETAPRRCGGGQSRSSYDRQNFAESNIWNVRVSVKNVRWDELHNMARVSISSDIDLWYLSHVVQVEAFAECRTPVE